MKYSIVIPTKDRSETLRRILIRISKLEYSLQKFEIIVVDNKSTDASEKDVEKFDVIYPKIITSNIIEQRIGPSFARNKGIENANYQYIVCIDDDVVPPRNLLKKYEQIIDKHPNMSLAVGKVKAVSKDEKRLRHWLNILGKENSWVFSQTERTERERTIVQFPDSLISANILINKKMYKNKVFNEMYGRKYGCMYVWGEDTELALRTLLSGGIVIYDPTIVSKHIIGEEKLNVVYVLKRFFRAGIENRLIDKEFKGKVGLYKFSLRNYLRLLKKSLFIPNSKNLLQLVKETLFFIGYYFPLTKDR